MNRLISFLKDVRVELAKVSWPTQRDTIRYTITVVIMALAVACFLTLWDLAFTWILENIIT